MLRSGLPGLFKTGVNLLKVASASSPAVYQVIFSNAEMRSSWGSAANSSSLFNPARGFSASGEKTTNKQIVEEANSILQRIDAAHFREVLDQESNTRWNMEHQDFLDLCISSGAATSKEEAVKICDALDLSGVVLRVKNLVYLRPLEVAEIIYQALPDTDVEVRARLQGLKAEIAPLLQQKQHIDSHAQRVSRLVLWGGLVAMVGQWGLFARLTFWELSWDVMEPVTYFTGAAFGITAYAYCLWYNEEFGYHRARERIHTSVADRTYARKGFDKARFDYLLQRIHRLESSLSAVAPLEQRSVSGNSAAQHSGSEGNMHPA